MVKIIYRLGEIFVMCITKYSNLEYILKTPTNRYEKNSIRKGKRQYTEVEVQIPNRQFSKRFPAFLAKEAYKLMRNT